MGNSDIKADVGKEVLYLAKDLLRDHTSISQWLNSDINYILFKHQVNMTRPRYDFLNKKEWLFVYKLELNLLQFLEIISQEENNRIFEMLLANEDDIYIAVLSLKQFWNTRRDTYAVLLGHQISNEDYTSKIATPELMMFKMKNKL
jgi:hypothetical protein